ncbi:MAG TPA: glycosyltransferase family 4 protein [Gemmataceae bacterium]|nr:glycosyltransferase family 4 protein [Gemmataceae bacterium]
MSLRVAHFVQRYPPALGGSEAYFARLSRFLVSHGDQVTVLTTNAEALESFWSPSAGTLSPGADLIDGVEVRRYAMSHRFRGRRWVLKPLSLVPHRAWQCLTVPCNPFAWGMWRTTGDVFDVVHATAFPYAFPILCAQKLARRLRVPFFLTPFLHLGDPLQPRDPTRRVYTSPAMMSLAKNADCVFAQTTSEQAALVGCGVDPKRIVRQGLGVEAKECTGGNRQQTRQAWGVSSEVVIGHLANNSEEKGTIDLLRATEKLHRQGLAFRVVLAGPEMPSFRRFWQGYGLADTVIRLGPLSASQKRDFFASIDVFALPSRSDSFGLVLLEAWANGVPNVAYRAGGIADVVRDGQDGLLSPCGDITALSGDIRRLVMDAGLRQRLGMVGQQRVGREFRWADKLALVRDAYYTLAKPQTATSSRRGAIPWACGSGSGSPP